MLPQSPHHLALPLLARGVVDAHPPREDDAVRVMLQSWERSVLGAVAEWFAEGSVPFLRQPRTTAERGRVRGRRGPRCLFVRKPGASTKPFVFSCNYLLALGKRSGLKGKRPAFLRPVLVTLSLMNSIYAWCTTTGKSCRASDWPCRCRYTAHASMYFPLWLFS